MKGETFFKSQFNSGITATTIIAAIEHKNKVDPFSKG